MPLIVDNHKLWRERAKQARALAASIVDAAAKASMIEVAVSYDRMAERAEVRTALSELRRGSR